MYIKFNNSIPEIIQMAKEKWNVVQAAYRGQMQNRVS